MRDFGRVVKTDKLMGDTTALFPAVNFSCAGNIFAWTAAGEYHGNGQRRDPQLGTCCSAESFADSSRRERLRHEDKKYVYRFTLAQPLSFIEDDIVVIKQHKKTVLKVFYSEDGQRRRRMPQQSPESLTNSIPLITFGKFKPSTRFHTTCCHITHSSQWRSHTLSKN